MTTRDPWLPLAGKRILDFGWVVSGPVVGAFLASLGAEVIKLENRVRADSLRLRDALVGGEIDWARANAVPTFHALNRGKRSVAVDIKQPGGLDVVKGLVERSDALVENFSAGALARMGLDDDELRRLNPGLVHLGLSPAGRSGRLSALRGYAATTGSLAGLEGAVGYDADHPTGMLTFGLADYSAGAHAAFALIAALRATDEPVFRSIDASQLEANMLSLGAGFAALHAGLPTVPANRSALDAPHGIFPTADDGYVAVAVRDDPGWTRLVEVLDLELPSRLGRAERRSMMDDIEREVARRIARLPRDHAVACLREEGLDAAPVLRMTERATAPFHAARDADVTVAMTNGASATVPATPWRVDGRRAEPPGRDRAPDLGEDTEWACTELLGMSGWEFRDLRDGGVVG